MYAGIEKVGNAQDLQYGTAATRSQHFGISAVLRSMRKHMRLANEKTAVVVDLTTGPLSTAINDGIGMAARVANENCLHPATRSNNQ